MSCLSTLFLISFFQDVLFVSCERVISYQRYLYLSITFFNFFRLCKYQAVLQISFWFFCPLKSSWDNCSSIPVSDIFRSHFNTGTCVFSFLNSLSFLFLLCFMIRTVCHYHIQKQVFFELSYLLRTGQIPNHFLLFRGGPFLSAFHLLCSVPNPDYILFPRLYLYRILIS